MAVPYSRAIHEIWRSIGHIMCAASVSSQRGEVVDVVEAIVCYSRTTLNPYPLQHIDSHSP